MIYSILLAALIYVNTSHRLLLQSLTPPTCTEASTAVDCAILSGMVPTGEDLVCYQGICLIGCGSNGATTCDSVGTSIGRTDLICDDTDEVCLPAPPTDCSNGAACETGEACSSDNLCAKTCPDGTGCETLQSCVEDAAGGATIKLCKDDVTIPTLCPVGNECHATAECVIINTIAVCAKKCTKGNGDCAASEMCETYPGSTIDVCLPDVALPPDTTSTAPDLSCTPGNHECETKAGALIPDAYVASFTSLGLALKCDPEISRCTMTCDTPTEVCSHVAGNMAGVDALECVDSSIGKICREPVVDDGTTTAAPHGDTTTAAPHGDTTTAAPVPTCDDDICDSTLPNCVDDPVTGDVCAIKFDFDVNVCILNKFWNRPKIYRYFDKACEFIAWGDDAICDNAVVQVEAYTCKTAVSSTYPFDFKPNDANMCPDNVDETCVKDNVKKFTANIVGTVVIYCDCDSNVLEIGAGVKAAVDKVENFVEKVKELSITDDTFCGKGMGMVVANELTVTVTDKDGNENIIFGAATQKYIYGVGMIVMLILSLL